MSQHVYEAAVVGAGPIGIELAVALKRANIDYVHFDARQIAYTISWYAPQTRFFSSNERIAIAGVPLVTAEQQKATREQYLAYLRGVVEQYDLQVNTYEPVIGIDREGDHFRLTTRPAAGERTTLAKRLILATGGTDRPRMLGVEGEDLPHVSHYFGDPHHYFRRKLLVVGGRNSAVEAALRCHHAGASVAFSYRRDALVEKSIKYWLLPEFKSLVNAGRIRAYFKSHVKRITPTQVELMLEGAGEFTIDADFVLLLTGYQQDNALLKAAGVTLDGPQVCPRYNPDTMETNIPNLYVAGTAIGGTQERFTVFIENCHIHVERIMGHAFGIRTTTPDLATAVEAPES
jgi:thioredoxin reductase (NADPH)